jgi:putative ABC transport system permease protein
VNADSIAAALRGVSANKLRSSLTVLGILIGVAAVIVLVAVGNGSSQAIQAQIDRLGTNTLTVFNRAGFGRNASSGVKLDAKDVTDLNDRAQAPDVASASPIAAVTSATATNGSKSTTLTTFYGSDAKYLATTNRPVDVGRALTADDVSSNARVVVIGRTVATDLFAAGADVLNSTIKINDVSFTVVGVQAAKGTNGNQDLDDFVIAPYTTVQKNLVGKATGFTQIVVQGRYADTQTQAQAEVLSILNTNHGLTTATSPFSVANQASLLQTSQDTNRTFTILLGAVAAISLLVGGIGVMNIMLVTVTERTREIGIRKAIGAPPSAILGQFITEAVILTFIGGVAGILVGVVVSQLEIVGVQPVIAGYSIPLAFGVSLAVGLFFGIYPANRAASLRPIDALRHE